MLTGHAEPTNTADFADRFPAEKGSEFYRLVQGLQVSSIGIGSYLGDLDQKTDKGYTEAMKTALRGGINFIDTSLNYRNQRSEHAIDTAIRELSAAGELRRGDFVISTKAGYLVPNAVPTVDPKEVVGKIHCLSPGFLADQLERSLVNLGLDAVDIFYLHNPEMQLKSILQAELNVRFHNAFEMLEQKVSEGKIQFYGAATWEGFRRPVGHLQGLSFTAMVEIARSIAGEAHHFRFIQLPVNLSMAEAITQLNEDVNGKPMNVLEAAARFGISVVSSASLLQAHLAKNLPDEVSAAFPGFTTDAQRALQFSRSAPGVSVSLVGMSNPAHVKENLALAAVPPLTKQEFTKMFAQEY